MSHGSQSAKKNFKETNMPHGPVEVVQSGEIKMPMGIPLWEIEHIKPDDNNARTHSQEQVEQIAASMLEFGFTNPVLVDGDGSLMAGHGRLMAANYLGLKKVPVVQHFHLTPKQKRAYLLADNQLALNASWDVALLKSELKDLKDDDFDLGLLGFSDKELKGLLDEVGGDGKDEKSESSNGNYKEQYAVMVICNNAAHQEQVYYDLTNSGHNCKVVVT